MTSTTTVLFILSLVMVPIILRRKLWVLNASACSLAAAAGVFTGLGAEAFLAGAPGFSGGTDFVEVLVFLSLMISLPVRPSWRARSGSSGCARCLGGSGGSE